MPDTTPPVVPAQAPPVGVVVPPAEPPKKGPGLLWLILILAIAAAGAGGYFLYTQLQKPVEQQTSVTPPRLATQEGKPDQGFDSQPAATTTPSASPTITATDSVSDIEKDMMGTSIEGENTSEFDADLQSL